jgi:ATP-dependent DNA helicase PIF1
MENLSIEQLEVYNKYINSENIFITGPGGCGKTYLIRLIVDHAKKNIKEYQVCAMTGCAAILLNCSAKTIHSWSGIGLANGNIDDIVFQVTNSRSKRSNWKKVEILIIDEISMLSLKLFIILDKIARIIKKKPNIPFGGIQLIFSGDFYQLPPVSNNIDDIESNMFCFENELWDETFKTPCFLKTIFRQKNDNQYSKILNEIRIGRLHRSTCELLNKQVNKKYDNIIKPTILFPRRSDVDNINKIEYNKLDGEEKSYKIESNKKLTDKDDLFSEIDKDYEINYLTNNIMAEKNLSLKIGTIVMCVANIDMDSEFPIVNGSQGTVIEFVGNLPKVKFTNGTTRVIAKHTWVSEKIKSTGVLQIPLIYAWAITIHKSQGVTLDVAMIDVGNSIFECGQTYVALSRITSLDGLFLKGFNPLKIKVNKKVLEYYNKFN